MVLFFSRRGINAVPHRRGKSGAFRGTHPYRQGERRLNWLVEQGKLLEKHGPDGVKLLLDDLAPKNPKLAGADPKSFIDTSLVQEVEASGFLKQLYQR
jgi:hypothetical protein